MNILVTGGAGFIGSNFLNYFAPKGKANIINLDALTYAGNLENLRPIENTSKYSFVKGNITDSKLLDSLFDEYKIDGVINFAAESHVDRSITGSQVFISTNIVGTHSLLECSRRYKVKKFLQVSTDEVYGSLGAEGYFTENTNLKPNSPYSSSKASADLIARSYVKTFGLPVVITRCSNNYGPYQFPEKLIPLMINNCINRKPLPVYGKGENIRDWIHVIDHNKAIENVFFNGTPGEIYNVGSNNEWKNIDIVYLITSLMEKKLNIKNELKNLITFVKDRPGHDLRYAIDSSKIEKELGWKAKISFEEGINETIDWYLNNKPWIENVTSGAYKDYYKSHYDQH